MCQRCPSNSVREAQPLYIRDLSTQNGGTLDSSFAVAVDHAFHDLHSIWRVRVRKREKKKKKRGKKGKEWGEEGKPFNGANQGQIRVNWDRSS